MCPTNAPSLGQAAGALGEQRKAVATRRPAAVDLHEDGPRPRRRARARVEHGALAHLQHARSHQPRARRIEHQGRAQDGMEVVELRLLMFGIVGHDSSTVKAPSRSSSSS